MDGFTHKTFTTSRNYTYAYYVYRPSEATSKPALFLCHGYPDNALLWADIVPALLPLGHPIIVPDLLGYDGTSKPTDPSEYNSKLMANDLYELADSESFPTIIPTGHDWGSYMAQRLYLWRPTRCAGLILLNVAYQPPSNQPFNLSAALDFAEQRFGYPSLAYWEVFADPQGAALLSARLETFFHLLHWDDPNAMRTVFCTRGALRPLLDDAPEKYSLKPYAKGKFKEEFLARFRRDGLVSPQCWYRVVTENVASEAEKEIPKENLLIKVPCLYISSTGDTVCRTDLMEPVKGLVPDLETYVVDANHWCPYEKPEEVRGFMAEWLKKKF